MKTLIACLTMMAVSLIPLEVALAQDATWTDSTPYAHVIAIAGNEDILWVATSWGLSQIDKSTMDILMFRETIGDGINPENITVMKLDLQGNLWVGTNGMGLFMYNGTDWTTYDSNSTPLPHDEIKALAVDNSGNMWVGTKLGAAEFDGTNWEVYTKDNSELPNNTVYAFAFNSDDSVWFGTNWGLAFFDGETWLNYSTSNSDLPNNTIYTLLLNNDDLWIGTRGSLARLSGDTWTVYDEEDIGLSVNASYDLTSDSQGIISFYNNKGLVRYDGNDWTVYTKDNSGLCDHNFTDITCDDNGDLWVGTYTNLFQLKGSECIQCETGFMAGPDTWSRKTDMPVARWGSGVSMVDGIIYVLGGFTFSESVAYVHAYNPETDMWMEKSPLPSPLSMMYACAVNDKIYVFGGSTGSGGGRVYDYTVKEYDPAAETWVEKSAMPNERNVYGICEIGGMIYLLGGWNNNTQTGYSVVETYDPALDSWAHIADLSVEKSDFACCVVDGIIYMIGGWGHVSGNWVMLDAVETYDPGTNSFETKSSIPVAVTNAESIYLDGKIYVIGGHNANERTAAVWEYNLEKDSWTEKNPMPTPRSYTYCFTIDGKIYSVTGTDIYGERSFQYGQDYGVSLVLMYDPGELSTGIENIHETTPVTFSLMPNYPNPFNPSTVISYSLERQGLVNLVIYDALGRKVDTLVDSNQRPGTYSVRWDSERFASGVYFYRLKQDGGAVLTRKMLIMK